MNDIIKNIEAAQLREDAPQFNVGDTVLRIQLRSKRKPSVSRYSKVLF